MEKIEISGLLESYKTGLREAKDQVESWTAKRWQFEGAVTAVTQILSVLDTQTTPVTPLETGAGASEKPVERE